MNRWFSLGLASLALVAIAGAPSVADTDKVDASHGRIKLMTHVIEGAPPQEALPAGALGGQTIFLNHCVGGCTVRPGMDDASSDTSSIAKQVTTIAEYTFQAGEWANILQCVKEVYSPFNVHVTDVRPAGPPYEEIIVGGTPDDLMLPVGVGGIGSLQPGCAPNPKGVSFAFTSAIDVFAGEDGGSRVFGMCWIIAQETAHNFGLDHEYEFVEDGKSACNDPMTYRADCGGQKFFRNKIAKAGSTALCGTNADPANVCLCGGNQNSHGKMIDNFGPGTSLIPPPSAVITLPAANGALGASVIASIGSKRGVERAEVYLNGYLWRTLPGAAFGPQGQVNPTAYQFTLPTEIPNSIYDIVVKGYDDLGILGTSATLVATKGPTGGCATADTCLKGQNCANGRCFWDPPVGELGEPCPYPQFCKSGLCQGTADQSICTQDCIPGSADSCPNPDLSCIESTPGHGICFFTPDSGGCCSVGDSSNAWIPGGLGALVFGFLVIRPRRRR